jgi:hypothetical protein
VWDAEMRRHSTGCFPVPEAAFLKACGLCKRGLGPGRDTFIYMCVSLCLLLLFLSEIPVGRLCLEISAVSACLPCVLKIQLLRTLLLGLFLFKVVGWALSGNI